MIGRIKTIPMKTARSLGIVLAIASLGQTGLITAFAAEPTYQGKTASFWLECGGTNTAASVAAFKAMGTNAVPLLIETLERKPSKLGELVDKQIADYNLKHPGGVPNQFRSALPSAYRVGERRELAVFFLGQLGPAAEAAIPVLFRIYTDTNEGWRIENEVSQALGAMGEKGVVLLPHYFAWLTNADPKIQVIGAGFLGSIGPKARGTVPELLKVVDGTNRNAANAAALALWSIDRQTNVALRVHTRQLQQTNHTSRQLAISYLGEMGPAAAEAAPQLEPFLRDPDSVIREQAEKALGAIDPRFLESSQQRLNASNDGNLERIVRMLREGDFREKYQALGLVGLYGPAARSAVPALIDALDGFSPTNAGVLGWTAKMNSQHEAAEALAEIGPDAAAARPALMARVRIGASFHSSFCKALGRIGPPAQEAIPVLEDALRDENLSVRLSAADALTRIIPNQCPNAVAVLRALQHDPKLAQVWQSDGHGMSSPTSRLDFENPQSRMYRLSAAVPLWRLHLESQSPVPALLQEMGKPESADAIWCVELLGDLGPDAQEALPKLALLVGPEKWSGLRRAAAIAIRKIDPQEAKRLNLPGILAVP
jgi:HEAT repeat protein